MQNQRWESKRRRGIWTLAGIFGVLMTIAAQAAPPVWISEGSRPTVAIASSGDTVVVWQKDDGSDDGIYGRLFSGFAMPQGTEFQINAQSNSAQEAADVAHLPSGGYVVVWQSDVGNRTKVVGRRLDAAAMPQGTEFQVNRTFTGLEPAVGSDSHGNFFVTWVQTTAANPALGSPVKFHHYLRAFDSSGAPLSDEERFGEKSGLTPPAIAVLPSGDSLVVWEDKHADVRGQLFDRFAMPQGTEFQVNLSSANTPLNPAVTLDGNGGFVVAWESELSGGNRAVLGRAVSSGLAAMPQGTEFQVSVTPFQAQADPAAAVDPSGQVVVTWQCILTNSSPHGEVIARLVDQLAMPQGTEYVVNSQVSVVQQRSDIASDGGGGFVVVWEAQDMSGSQIYGEAIPGATLLSP